MVRLIPEVTASPFVDGIAVQLELLRTGLPGTVNVYSKIPDQLREKAQNGAVVIRRAGGQSALPQFHSRFLMSYRVWHPSDQAAYQLATAANTLIFNAWLRQTVTSSGHIASWAEQSGLDELSDPGLPEFGSYLTVVDLLIRTPRAA